MTMVRLALCMVLMMAGGAWGNELATYHPSEPVSGVIRIRGSDAMQQVIGLWIQGFRRFHPEVAFETTLKGNASAMIGLEEGTADIVAMTRRIVPYDTYGVWRRAHHMPIEVTVATGSFDVAHKAAALAVFVHADNPVTGLTLEQLDGIFGAQRTGGWNGMLWDVDAARDESKDIRNWGQLGAKGEWERARIRPYGPPGLFPGGMSFFQIRVLHGADTRAENLLEFDDPARLVEALSRDRFGIGYASLAFARPGVKAIALAEAPGGPFVPLTRENVRNGSYPLSRSIYFYLPPDGPAGEPLVPRIAPKVREFLRYVLSREGQDDVAREGAFVPLSDAAARAQSKALEQANAIQGLNPG
jgi:phosphate transport system substrate-binding protein